MREGAPMSDSAPHVRETARPIAERHQTIAKLAGDWCGGTRSMGGVRGQQLATLSAYEASRDMRAAREEQAEAA